MKVNRNSRSALLAVAVAAAIIAAACQRDATSSPDLFAANLWTLSEREARIGSVDDPDYIFGAVLGMALGPDGLLYTTHRRESSIRRWTADGAPAGSLGRKGEGPGEFEQLPSGLGFFGDSLWVWDHYARRVSYFDLERKFLGSVSLRVDPGSMWGSLPQSVPLRDGTFIVIGSTSFEAIARGPLTETPFVRMDADGRTSARVWEQPREPHDVFWILTDRGGSVRGQPFEDSYLLAFGQRGLLVVERRAWTGEGEPAIRVTGIGFDGDTTFRVAVPYNPVPLARERIDSVVHAWVEEEPDDPGAFTPSEAQIREALYQPSYLPAVDHLLEADDGTIWLRRFDRVQLETGEQMIEWWVLDSAATPLARALTPVGLDVRLITSDMVWGIERDELDIEYIVRCRLTKDG